MYNGTIKTKPNLKKDRINTKYQVLTKEEIECNGVISEQITLKTNDYVPDKNITVRDFDILNLKKTGAYTQLKEVQLTRNIESVEKQAAMANKVMKQIDIINAIENGEQD